MPDNGRPPRAVEGHSISRRCPFQRTLCRRFFLWALVGSIVVLFVNLFLLRGTVEDVVEQVPPSLTVEPPALPPPSLTVEPPALPPPPELQPIVTLGTMGTAHDVRKYGVGPSGFNFTTDQTGRVKRNALLKPEGLDTVTPIAWDSASCMEHWRQPELLTEADPNGYLVFVNGREQLGGNKYLLADGMFIAKMLNRTLVEFPVKDARISSANSTMGLGAYWDLSAMCMNHRILDIHAFRRLVETGRLTPDDFITIDTEKQKITTRHFRHRDNVINYYQDKLQYKVIVMERTTKSTINRHNMFYLTPNPFYLGLVRMLVIGHEDFRRGEFLAVQWRTETSTGNISACYDQVRTVIEEHRMRLGFTKHQVLFSTDMVGNTSDTYKSMQQNQIGKEAARRIREDYPKALDSRVHEFINTIEDSGVKAIITGLVVAQASMLLASSLNKPELKAVPEACVCQKPFSGYIRLITQWRAGFMHKAPETLVRLFPFGDLTQDEAFVTTTDSNIPNL